MQQEHPLVLSRQSLAVLNLAEEEARRSYHPYIATEHLLFALLSQHDSVAVCILRNLGISIGKLRHTIEFVLPRTDHLVQDAVVMTAQARQVLDCAEYEAYRLQHPQVDPEHLLLGILRQSRGRRGQGLAGAILHKFQVTLDDARDQTSAIYRTRHTQNILPVVPSTSLPPPPPPPPGPQRACSHCSTSCPPKARFCFLCGSPHLVDSE
jgi:ATP-dependent Clp protease ATP-binding subunit ClpA